MLVNTPKLIISALIAVNLIACQSTSTKVTSNQNAANINEVAKQDYNGPKARIAVARFTDKSNDVALVAQRDW